MGKKYWLMKSEPGVFSIDDLKEKGREPWDGVRNYQARNFMRDEMKIGDGVLFYHSACNPPGVAGLAEVSKEAFGDFTAWDADSPYYDPKSSPENPRWVMVEVKFVERFSKIISLDELKGRQELEGFRLLQRGNRLSILPVSPAQFRFIISLAKS
ncbi:MAG: EVE domain-containing protein [Bacteriovoracales bacterium]|nr:EVE domain-containing protein [Bacteriovoracales bacterium]